MEGGEMYFSLTYKITNSLKLQQQLHLKLYGPQGEMPPTYLPLWLLGKTHSGKSGPKNFNWEIKLC